jgi:hypothetical protein
MKKRLLFLLSFLSAMPVLAQEFPTGTLIDPTTTTSPSVTVPDEGPLINEFSVRFNVGAGDIAALRQRGVGWTELGNALSIAQRSGRPLQEVVNSRAAGTEWDVVAQRFGVLPGMVDEDVRFLSQRVIDFHLQNRPVSGTLLPGTTAPQPSTGTLTNPATGPAVLPPAGPGSPAGDGTRDIFRR